MNGNRELYRIIPDGGEPSIVHLSYFKNGVPVTLCGQRFNTVRFSPDIITCLPCLAQEERRRQLKQRQRFCRICGRRLHHHQRVACCRSHAALWQHRRRNKNIQQSRETK